ncbi:MAG: porin [Planctomycetota bacterium]
MNRPTFVAGLGVLVSAGSAFATTTGGDDGTVNAAAAEPAVTIPVLDNHESGGAMWNNGFHIMSADEQHKLRIGARIDFDANFVSIDGAEGSAADNDTIGFRRSRIMLEGMSYGAIGYRAVVDFNGPGGGTEFADLYLTLENFLVGRLTAGQFFEPFGLEANTYSENISLQERSLSTALIAPGRGTGVMVSDFVEDTNFGWALGVFSSQGGGAFATTNLNGTTAGISGSFSGNSTGIGTEQLEANYAITGRATFAPVMNEDGSEVVHVGASFSTRGTENTGLDSDADGVNDVFYDDDVRFGLEAAGVFGPLSLQAEFMSASLGGEGTAADLDIDGLYVQAAYMITGETRQYSKGTFGPVVPDSEWNGFGSGGTGALEGVIRWSDTSIDAGTETDTNVIDLGANWYMNQNSRFMAGISIIDSDSGDAEALNFRWQVII